MMTGSGEEQMVGLLGNESMGGNAGTDHGRPCLLANFEFDGTTGEIKRFTNHRNDKELKRGSFRTAITRKGSYEIIETNLPPGTSSRAREIIGLSVRLFNQVEEK